MWATRILRAMSRRPARLLQRLRLNRGVWMLLLFAAFIKVASATACLLDGPRPVMVPDASTETSHFTATTNDGAAGSDEVCMLGETGDCHCACAHASTLPSPALIVIAHGGLPSVAIHPPVAASMRILASPLRPPIA